MSQCVHPRMMVMNSMDFAPTTGSVACVAAAAWIPLMRCILLGINLTCIRRLARALDPSLNWNKNENAKNTGRRFCANMVQLPPYLQVLRRRNDKRPAVLEAQKSLWRVAHSRISLRSGLRAFRLIFVSATRPRVLQSAPALSGTVWPPSYSSTVARTNHRMPSRPITLGNCTANPTLASHSLHRP